MALPRVCVTVGPDYGFDVDDMDPSFRDRVSKMIEMVDFETAKAQAHSNPVVAVVCFAHSHISKDVANQLSPTKPLKAVVNYGVGVDHLDLEGLAELNIPTSNTPNVLSHATADMAWALLMACARHIPQGDAYCRQGQFTEYRNMVLLGKAVQGTTLGIIGMGRIGEQIARRASGFDMTVLYHNRSRKPEAEEQLGVEYAELDKLLKTSDYVVLACPCTAETTGLINADRFAMMKSTASLINISRGPVVKTDDLVEALLEGYIESAGLDVFDPEPLPAEHALYKLENVVCAPHRGSGTREARQAMIELVVANLKAALADQPLVTRCN